MKKSRKKSDCYDLPKFGFGAFLAKDVSEKAIHGLAGTAATAGQVGRPSGFKGFLTGAGGGAALGAKLGTVIPGVGNLVGALGGGLIGGIGGMIRGRRKRAELDASLEDQQDELAERMFAENEARLELQRSKGVLAQYPVEGIEGANYFGRTFGYGGNMYGKRKLKSYALGGRPDYLAEGGEAIEFDEVPQVHGQGEMNPVSSTMGEIEGPSHSSPSGGVPMSGGERIYSDRLYPTDELKGVLKSLGITSTGTYADIAKRIGKKESKQESAVVSDDRFEKNRGEKMLEKYSLAKELVFADQEANKPMEDEEVVDMTGMQEEFSYGGRVPKYGFGASMAGSLGRTAAEEYQKMQQQQEREALGMMNTNLSPNPETPSFMEDQETRPSFLERTGNFLNKNADMVASGANYFMNERLIDRMPLTQRTRMFDPVLLDDSRRDQLQQHIIGQGARQGMRAAQASGTQTRNALVGDIVSRAMNASNQVADTETRRIDNIRNINAQISNSAGQYNTALANETYGDYQANRMLQLSERMKNRNNLTASILGNLQVRKMNEMDQMRMKLISERDRERGIIGRSETFQQVLDAILKR